MLDLREIDSKLGPMLKWDRKKLIEEPQSPLTLAGRIAKRSGGRYPRAAKYLEETGRRYNINHNIPEIARPFYKFDENLGLPILRDGTEDNFDQPPTSVFVSPALGYPHPTNYDLEHFPCPLSIPNHNCSISTDHSTKGKVVRSIRI